jgi:cytochrome c-type protein NapB
MNKSSSVSSSKPSWLRTGYRLVFIGLIVVLMAATVYVLGTSWIAGQTTATLEPTSDAQREPAVPEPIRVDAGSLTYLDLMQRYVADAPSKGVERTLERYYAQRAYDGAPPWIPHVVSNGMTIGDGDCLQCHQVGGYAPALDAYAPVSPHPDLPSCTQCHVAAQEESVFRENTYRPADPPTLTGGAYVGAPPPVPHALQMRDNCAACHVGPSAPSEIRVDHLERDNCLQCHVPTHDNTTWTRPQQAWSPESEVASKEGRP